jgi:hypothetical protein
LLHHLAQSKLYMAMFSLDNHCINHKGQQSRLAVQRQVSTEGVN